MEWMTRIELATPCLEGRDSTVELHPHINKSGSQRCYPLNTIPAQERFLYIVENAKQSRGIGLKERGLKVFLLSINIIPKIF